MMVLHHIIILLVGSVMIWSSMVSTVMSSDMVMAVMRGSHSMVRRSIMLGSHVEWQHRREGHIVWIV